jgi:hypothetical protein
MIDPAPGLFEIVKATNILAASVQDLFHNTCLELYPHPQFIVFDNDNEFKRCFKQMCNNYGIKAKPTTSHILEKMQSLSEYKNRSMKCSDHLI